MKHMQNNGTFYIKKQLKSHQLYRGILDNHIIPAFKDRRLYAITANDLRIVMNSMSSKSKSFVGYVKTILSGVFSLAYAQGIIDRDPSVSLSKTCAPKSERRALTDLESDAVLKVGFSHAEGLLLLLLYYTGLRVGEALGLQWRDIDFNTSVLSVDRDIDHKTKSIYTVKTPSSVRNVPIPQPLLSVLITRRGIGEAHLIQTAEGNPYYSRSAYRNLWNRLMSAVKKTYPEIECNQRNRPVITAHYLRHNYAYNGIDVLTAQKILGHKDAKTTLSLYTHLSEKQMDNGAKKIMAMFSGNHQNKS